MTDKHARRMNILNLVASGELTLDQGNRLLTQLDQQSEDEEMQVAATVWPTSVTQDGDPPESPAAPAAPAVETLIGTASEGPAVNDPPPTAGPAPVAAAAPDMASPAEVVPEENRSGGSRGWWLVPFLLGLLLTLVSVNWMYLGFAAAGLGWGFWLSFLPLALGILLMWAGWEMRGARWLHLRVRQSPGHTPSLIAISFPLPIGLTRWAVQRFGRYSPGMNGQNPVDILDELDQALAADGPMHIYVDSEHGEQVELWVDGPRQNK